MLLTTQRKTLFIIELSIEKERRMRNKKSKEKWFFIKTEKKLCKVLVCGSLEKITANCFAIIPPNTVFPISICCSLVLCLLISDYVCGGVSAAHKSI